MPEKRGDEAILKEIRESYEEFSTFWEEQRCRTREDTLIMANKPFTELELKRRGTNRPMVLTDQVGQYTNQIVNNIRQNPRGVNFFPQNVLTNEKWAEKRANIARQIEKDSDAQAVYSTAFEHAVSYGGMGYMRFEQKYESHDSDKQIIRLRRVPNPLSILPDPYCEKIDFADMKRCLVLDSMTHSRFGREYPDANAQFDDGHKREYPKWIQDKTLQIAEYWCVKKKNDRLLIMDTTNIRESQLGDAEKFEPSGDENAGGVIHNGDLNIPPLLVKRWRKIEPTEVWQYHTNGIEIMERLLWDKDGDSIPIYPVVGREQFVDDGSGPKKQYVSSIRFVSWAVKGMMYVRSLQIEIAQMTPKTPYMAIEGQLEGMKGWKTLNTDPAAYVYYRAKLDAMGDMILPPPTRVPFDPSGAIQGLELLHNAFQQDLQNAMGMYRASVGNDRGTTSGKMVQELDKQSDQGSYHFTHNFNQSVERLWTDINKRMGKVYDSIRDVGALRADGSHEVVTLNDESNPQSLAMTKGEFSTSISVGPAMESQTQADQQLAETISQIPGVFDKVGDLVVKLAAPFGGPVRDEMARRLKPAGIDEDGAQPTEDELKRQVQALGQQLQETQAQLQEAAKIITTKQLENEAKVKTAKISAEASIEVANINAKAKGAAFQAELEADLIQQATGIVADEKELEQTQDHAAEMAELGHQATIAQQENQAKLAPKPNGKAAE